MCETSREPPGAALSVVPFLRLMMLLTDPCNNYHQSLFHLTADNAERFFGMSGVVWSLPLIDFSSVILTEQGLQMLECTEPSKLGGWTNKLFIFHQV